jgi:maleate isomerase
VEDDFDVVRPETWAGVLVPPANPAVEPELQRCIAPAIALFAARFAVMPGTTLEQRNRRYVELYRDAVRSFGDMKVAAMIIGLTGPSYRLMPDGDLALTQELTALAGGVPVETASQAIAKALKALGARRLCLVSPYPEWLTNEAIAYWRGAGHEIVQIVKVSESFRAYELTGDEIGAALARIDNDAIDATVMSGTGMLTLPAILAARRAGSKPILSSNLCSAWWLLRATSQREGSSMFGRATPELAARLGA